MIRSRALRRMAGVAVPMVLALNLASVAFPNAAEAADPCTTDPTGFACFLEAQANGLAAFAQQQAQGLQTFAMQEVVALTTPVEQELQQLVITAQNEVAFIETLPPQAIALAESTIATAIADAQAAILSGISTAEGLIASSLTTAENAIAATIADVESVVTGLPGSVTGPRAASSALYSEAFFFCSGAATPSGSPGSYSCGGVNCPVPNGVVCIFEEQSGGMLFTAGNDLYALGE